MNEQHPAAPGVGNVPCPNCGARTLFPSVDHRAWVCLDCDFTSKFDGTPGGKDVDILYCPGCHLTFPEPLSMKDRDAHVREKHSTRRFFG